MQRVLAKLTGDTPVLAPIDWVARRLERQVTGLSRAAGSVWWRKRGGRRNGNMAPQQLGELGRRSNRASSPTNIIVAAPTPGIERGRGYCRAGLSCDRAASGLQERNFLLSRDPIAIRRSHPTSLERVRKKFRQKSNPPFGEVRERDVGFHPDTIRDC